MEFRIICTVSKHDLKGQILKKMHNGTVISYDTLGEAIQVCDEFVELAKIIPNTFKSYGCISIMNEETGKVCSTYGIV